MSTSSSLSPVSLFHLGAVSRFILYHDDRKNELGSKNWQSAASSFHYYSFESLIHLTLMNLTSELERNVIPRMKHSYGTSSKKSTSSNNNNNNIKSFDEDDIICTGLGDWENTILQNSTKFSQIFNDLLLDIDDTSVLDQVKVTILGAKNCGSTPNNNNNSTGSSLVSKATRKHRKKVDALLVSSSASLLSSILRNLEYLVVFAILIKLKSKKDDNNDNSNNFIANWVSLLVLKAVISYLSATTTTSASNDQNDDDLLTVPSIDDLMNSSSSSSTAPFPRIWRQILDEERRKSNEVAQQEKRMEDLLTRIQSLKNSSKIVSTLQCFARLVIAKRTRRLLQKERTKRVRALHSNNSNNNSSSSACCSKMKTLIQNVLDREMRVAELGDYLENEPEKFKAEWREWENKMKNFYMKECELDPTVWKAVGVRSVEGDPTSEMQVRYLDLRSGKLQTEHPHKAKIFQIKQRQWLQATRTREATVAKAQKELTDIETLQIGPKGALSMEMKKFRTNMY